MNRQAAIEAGERALAHWYGHPGACPVCRRDAARVIDAAAPHLVVHVHHHDVEKRAEHFNEGYEAAMVQHLAEDPRSADEWLAAEKAKALREAALSMEAFPSEVSRLLRLRADRIERGEMP